MKLRSFLHDQRGATAIEYGMIAACVAILILSSLGPIGLSVEQMFADLMPAFAGTP